MLSLCILVLFQYHLDCFYREFIWCACLPFPVFAICFFISSIEKHSTDLSVFSDSSSCSRVFCLEELIEILFLSPFYFVQICQDSSIFSLVGNMICYVRYVFVPPYTLFLVICSFPGGCPAFSLAVDTKISCILFQFRSSPISSILLVTDA